MSDWIDVAATCDLPPGSYRVVEVDEVEVAVFNVDGEFHAIEDVCTHDFSPLTGGCLEGAEIACPRHGARFDVRTGEALTPPAFEAVAVLAVRVVDDTVQVRDQRWD